MLYIDCCQAQCWHLELWEENDPKKLAARVVFRCKSWRHRGSYCERWKQAQDYARVKEAIERFKDWYYLVLTFDQNAWPDKTDLYRAGAVIWSRLRKRLVHHHGAMRYVQTWERHANGGAHVNVMLNSPGLWAEFGTDWQACRQWMNPHAIEAGFGLRLWVETIRQGSGEMANYFCNLAKELVGAGKKNQVPYDAPPHFRRLRASRDTLAPVFKSGKRGRLVQCTIEEFLRGTVPLPIPAQERRRMAEQVSVC